MIPQFNETGYLPEGIHKATLNEIKHRLGSHSLRRKELFVGLQSLIRLLRKNKGSIKRFLLDGSYVTAKETPEDFDCILIVKKNFNFDSPLAKQLQAAKILFNAHLFTFMEEDVTQHRRLINLFGHDRDRKQKGLVEVIL